MERELVQHLNCPYCGGNFAVSREVEASPQRLRYALLRCRCFEFPVVDGVLLLSLAKAYGGPEEELQPYVPLQVAAISYLQKDDVAGLRGWIRRHAPLVADLMGEPDPHDEPYLSFSARMGRQLDPAVARELASASRYEVLGQRPGRRDRLRGLLKFASPGPVSAADSPTPEQEQARLADYYATRFYSPRANALALRLSSLPMNGRLLSLCCGHGVFENLLAALDYTPDRVSMDGQLINLLVTRRYANAGGSLICHDLQYPLPFRNGHFDAVFSSTCLPEIPAQKTFVTEARRVTSESGWTFFDGIWNLESGVVRVNPGRHYRYCQNFFERLEDYVDLFRECARPGDDVGVDIPLPTRDYRDSGCWTFGEDQVARRIRERDAPELSALMVDPRHFRGFTAAQPLRALGAGTLSLSPVYAPDGIGAQGLHCARQPAFAKVSEVLASKRFAGYPETLEVPYARLGDPEYLFEQFCAGLFVFLPARFDREQRLLASLCRFDVGAQHPQNRGVFPAARDDRRPSRDFPPAHAPPTGPARP